LAISSTEKRVRNYIRDARAKGYKDPQIKSSLLKGGVDSPTINKVMREMATVTKGSKKILIWGLVAAAILLIILLAVFFWPTGDSDVECSTDADCAVGYECVSGECVEEEVYIPPTDDDECDSDSDCMTGYECDDGDCVKEAAVCGDGVCESGESCVSDCGCDSDSDCEEDEECDDGECVEDSSSSGGSGGSSGGSSSGGDGTDGGDGTTTEDCTDGIDNDGDGLIDCNDVDCLGSSNGDFVCCYNGTEIDTSVCTGTTQCDDTTNECVDCIEGVLDCAEGYTCTEGSCIEDPIETLGGTEGERCNDGYDNDGDGLIDMNDRGCTGLLDDDERNECADEYDNDGDNLVDMYDFGCSSVADVTEDVSETRCNDGIDNDGDGLIDYGEDPGCGTPYVDDERNECGDGIDNDGDGSVDTVDSDCTGSADDSEDGQGVWNWVKEIFK
jgi:hypothetical protein